MVLGNLVRFLVAIQGIFNIGAGLFFISTPVFLQDAFQTNQTDTSLVFVIGLAFIIFGGILIAGVTRLQEV